MSVVGGFTNGMLAVLRYMAEADEPVTEENIVTESGVPGGSPVFDVLERFEKTGIAEYQDGRWELTGRGCHLAQLAEKDR